MSALLTALTTAGCTIGHAPSNFDAPPPEADFEGGASDVSEADARGGMDADVPDVLPPSDVPCDATACAPANPCHVGLRPCDGTGGCIDQGANVPNGTGCGADQVCSDGDCLACRNGMDCVPANPCHSGSVQCNAGNPTCTDLSANVPNGRPCGTGLVCTDGTCSACVSGGDCAPTGNVCHTGTFSCATGVRTCADLGANQPNGTPCGTNMVCSNGACMNCVGGGSCTPTNRCHTGMLNCNTGTPACMDTGMNAADGLTCGTNMFCNAGTCAPCTPGTSCTPATPCHTGTTTCTTGASVCMATSTFISNGTSCGTNQVCNNGTCTACTANLPCAIATPCHVGTTTCASGTSTCIDNGPAPNGSSCGSGMVCNGGSCVTCTAGVSCPPSNPCHMGTTVCGTGTSSCMDTTMPVANGVSCGLNQVCLAGTCHACTANTPCTPAPCHTGTSSCASGSQTCTDTGIASNGTSCGTGMTCNAGICIACTPGMACTPSNPCHVGAIGCTTGAAVCADTNRAVLDGTGCGSGMFCSGGICMACMTGATCTPANPCHNGTISCSTGSPVCNDANTNTANGTSCGSNMVCNAGSCVSCTAGNTCTPALPCHNGLTSCASGSMTCADQNTNLADGTVCGSGLVCRAGACVVCSDNVPCSPDGCHDGMTSCASGTSVCVPTTIHGNGTPCGTNMVCGNGMCNACTVGASCTPTNPCEAATYHCDTGTPVCTPTGQNRPDGTNCGPNEVCSVGMCVGCVPGMACTPANACHAGTLTCSTGPVCVAGGSLPDGTACTNGQCRAGTCSARTCREIKNANPSATSGAYSVYPDAGGALTVYCDMTTDGGGWTVLSMNGNLSTDSVHRLASTAGAFGPALPNPASDDWQLAGADQVRFNFTQVLVMAYGSDPSMLVAAARVDFAARNVGNGSMQGTGVTGIGGTTVFGCSADANLNGRTAFNLTSDGANSATVWGLVNNAVLCTGSGFIDHNIGLDVHTMGGAHDSSGWDDSNTGCGCNNMFAPSSVANSRGYFAVR